MSVITDAVENLRSKLSKSNNVDDALTTEAAKPGDFGLDVPLSAFDLLEGKSRAAAKVRTLNVAAFMLALLALAGFGMRSALAMLEESRATSELAALTASQVEVRSQLAAQRESGAVTAREVDAFIVERTEQIAKALEAEIDYPRLFDDLTNLGPDILITEIALAPTPKVEAPGGHGGEDAEGGPETAAELVEAAELDLGTISISGLAPDTASAADVALSLSDAFRFPYLEATEAGEVLCNPPRTSAVATTQRHPCRWVWKGRLLEDAVSERDQVRDGSGVETSVEAPPEVITNQDPVLDGTGVTPEETPDPTTAETGPVEGTNPEEFPTVNVPDGPLSPTQDPAVQDPAVQDPAAQDPAAEVSQ